MTEEKLDCRGLACPQPVLRVKELVDRGDVTCVRVAVDNPAARENVGRFLERSGYQVRAEERAGVFLVIGSRDTVSMACEVAASSGEAGAARRIAVLIGTDQMGSGDETLGRKLLFNFIGTLKELGPDLWRVILLNGGVKLTVDGAECLHGLQDLEKDGVTILVCGTCLGHFELLERKRVGETTNMMDIVTALQVADKVISFT